MKLHVVCPSACDSEELPGRRRPRPPSRRGVLIASALAIAHPALGHAQADTLEGIERRLGGRIGVFALDTGSGRTVRRRENERFALCSTFKAPLAAAVMRGAESGRFELNEPIRYDQKFLLPTSPVTQRSGGELTLGELCAAAVSYTDNTAANLLLARLGGPAEMAAFFRACGDGASRVDRFELALNENRANDPRDTTTPAAMAQTLQAFLLRDAVLSRSSREALRTWMLDERNGRRRIRSATPAQWDVANKPGTSTNGVVNDIAVLWRPARAPVVLCVYTNAPGASISAGEQVIADATRAVLAQLGHR